MTSERRRAANRANARGSTGPKTRDGKARSAQNGRRHGLRATLGTPAYANEIDALARVIAGADAGARRLRLAYRIAAAQIDLVRARRVRHGLLCEAEGDPDAALALYTLDRYERRALSRRKFAIREFDAAEESRNSAADFGRTNPSCQTATVAAPAATPCGDLHTGSESAQSRAERDFAPAPRPAYTACTSNAAVPEQCGGRGRWTP